MAVTESHLGSEQVDLKRNLHLFVATISEMGREFGLNPQLKRVRPQNAEATYQVTVATISESGFAGKLKQIVGVGDIVRILDAPPINGSYLADYLFVHKPLKVEIFSRVLRFVEKVERKTGVRIYLTPKADLTQWENE